MSPNHSTEASARHSVIEEDPAPDHSTGIESPGDVRRSMELDKKERASAKRQKLSDDYGDQLGQLEEQIKADVSKDKQDMIDLRTSQLNRLKELVQKRSEIEAEIVAHTATLKKAYDGIAKDLSVVLGGKLQDVEEALGRFQDDDDDDGSDQDEIDNVVDGHAGTGGTYEKDDFGSGSGINEPDSTEIKHKRKRHPASVPSIDTAARAGEEPTRPDPGDTTTSRRRRRRRVTFDIDPRHRHEYDPDHDEHHHPVRDVTSSSEEIDQSKKPKRGVPKKDLRNTKKVTKKTHEIHGKGADEKIKDKYVQKANRKKDKEEQRANLRAQTDSVAQAFHDRDMGTTTAPSKQAVDRAMKMAQKGMRAPKSNWKPRDGDGEHEGEE